MEDREPRWEGELAEVDPGVDDRQGGPVPERGRRDGHRLDRGLRADREDGDRTRHREERELLGGALREVAGTGRTPERPDVEQDEDGGERRHRRLGRERQGVEDDDPGVRERTGSPGEPEPGEHRGQAEEERQDVLPLGDPGDRLDVERVDGQERGGREGGQLAAAHRSGECVEEEDVPEVEEYVGEVMPAGVEAGRFDHGHVRQPGERDAVAVRRPPERESDALRGQAPLDDLAPRDVDGIVVADEVVLARLRVEGQDEEGEDRRREEGPPQSGEILHAGGILRASFSGR